MSSAESRLDEALARFKDGALRESIRILSNALAQTPNNGKLWELRGIVLHTLGDIGNAKHAIEVAALLIPLSASSQCVLARCYAATGHNDLALDMLQQLMSLEELPDDLLPAISAGLGAVGNFHLALKACRRAATAGVDAGQPFYGMAHYMGRLDYPLEMIASVLRRAIELEPERFQYRFALAKAYQTLGYADEAYNSLYTIVDEKLLCRINCANCVYQIYVICRNGGDQQLAQVCRQRLLEIKRS